MISGDLDVLCLAAVAVGGPGISGADIVRLIPTISANRRPGQGAVYVTLNRLEEKGWIESRRFEPPAPQGRGDRMRRAYRATNAGLTQLAMARYVAEAWTAAVRNL